MGVMKPETRMDLTPETSGNVETSCKSSFEFSGGPLHAFLVKGGRASTDRCHLVRGL